MHLSCKLFSRSMRFYRLLKFLLNRLPVNLFMDLTFIVGMVMDCLGGVVAYKIGDSYVASVPYGLV